MASGYGMRFMTCKKCKHMHDIYMCCRDAKKERISLADRSEYGPVTYLAGVLSDTSDSVVGSTAATSTRALPTRSNRDRRTGRYIAAAKPRTSR